MILRLCFILSTFLFYSGGGYKKTETPPQYSIPQKEEKPVSKTLKLIFAGDIMSQVPQIESAKEKDGSYDYVPCFQYIKPILETADLAIGNLECTLSETPPYTGYPHFVSPNVLSKALKVNGFDVIVTSNNHSLDNRSYGVTNTIDVLREDGFVQTGTFKNQAVKDLMYPLIIYKNGFKLALLNYTHHTNGFLTPYPTMVNRLRDMDAVKSDIDKAKALKPDFIIMFLHWGDEHKMHENANQRGVAQQLKIWGADMVIGSHPHVVQPIKKERFTYNKKQHELLVAYSLGNFISAQPFPNTEGGILAEVDLEKTETGTVVSDYHYIPVLRYTPYENGKMRFYALPISAYEGKEDALKMPLHERHKMAHFATKTRRHLDSFGVKERLFR